MRLRINLLLLIAALAAIAPSASGQGLGYPEAPHYSVSRPARYWFDGSWFERAKTGHIGFMATNGCDGKPICSLCDYSQPRVCDCQVRHFDLLGGVAGWFRSSACGSLCGCETQLTQHVAQKCATQKHIAVQKCARPPIVTQKCPPSKCVTQKCPPQKCATQKSVVQKLPTQKCAPQKSVPQKCPTQKCEKSCGCASKCGKPCGQPRCRIGLLDSLTDQISSLDLFCRPKCGCAPKCGGKPTLAKSKSGGYDPPMTLPVPMPSEEGEIPPQIDPAAPPEPMLEGADDVGTGLRSASPLDRSRGIWRRSRAPRTTIPRLLPADGEARDVSRISYEELIKIEKNSKPQVSPNKRLDVFDAASSLNGAAAGNLANPLRK